jgi:hypothetical protein
MILDGNLWWGGCPLEGGLALEGLLVPFPMYVGSILFRKIEKKMEEKETFETPYIHVLGGGEQRPDPPAAAPIHA